jgi:hypothetical protein
MASYMSYIVASRNFATNNDSTKNKHNKNTTRNNHPNGFPLAQAMDTTGISFC